MKHPIIPSPKLVDKLRDKVAPSMFSNTVQREVELIRAAYQAGADYELEECCEYISRWFTDPVDRLTELRNARRPKPPSLKEQALDALEQIDKLAIAKLKHLTIGDDLVAAVDVMRRALKALQELDHD